MCYWTKHKRQSTKVVDVKNLDYETIADTILSSFDEIIELDELGTMMTLLDESGHEYAYLFDENDDDYNNQVIRNQFKKYYLVQSGAFFSELTKLVEARINNA